MAVAVTDHNNILVADTFNHRLQMFTSEGVFITSVGSRGSGPLQFIGPFDVAINRNGKLFISDNGNHRVQVLNSDLTFSHCFGSEGEAAGQFNQSSTALLLTHREWCMLLIVVIVEYRS